MIEQMVYLSDAKALHQFTDHTETMALSDHTYQRGKLGTMSVLAALLHFQVKLIKTGIT